jgi:hypothetical protein
MHGLPESVRTVVSDKEGRFQLEGAPPDTVLQLQVQHPDYAAMSLFTATTPAEVPEEQKDLFKRAQQRWRFLTGDLTLTLAASRQLTLRTVYGDTGKPAAGVQVGVERVKESTSVYAPGKSDAEGKVLLHLPPGEYEADLIPPEGVDYVRTRQPVKVANEPTEQTAEIRVRRGAVLILEAVDVNTGKRVPGVSFLEESDSSPGGMFPLRASILRRPNEKDVTDANGKLRVVVQPGKRRYALGSVPQPAGARRGQGGGPPRDYTPIPRVELIEGQTLTLQFEVGNRPRGGRQPPP